MFGGKGGVGKSTSSAATALHFAMKGERTLLISTDLTPSLSDIFCRQIGPAETKVPQIDNLWALEIGLDEVMRRWKEKFGDQIYQAASAVIDMPYDDIIDYVGMAPGIQEEFLLDFILEYLRSGRFDRIIWDTAPAGDTLRLLALPGKFLRHLRAAPRFYLKAQDMLGLSQKPFLELIEGWVTLSEEIIRFFGNPENVEFIIVTTPEALGVYQSRRIISELAAHGIPVMRIVANGILSGSDNDFLRSRGEMQQKYLSMLRDEYGADAIVQVPLFPCEVRGVEQLKEVASVFFSE